MHVPFEEIIKILVGECYARRNFIFIFFIVISLTLLALGAVWPKRYTAFSMILVDQTNILQPLMQGTAEATRLNDRASNAREIIYGERIMAQILEKGGWLESNPDDILKEKIKQELKEKIIVRDVGDNLLKLEYSDSNQNRAYIVAKAMADLFINEGEKSKLAESEAAFEFIEKQVNEYLAKLTKAEDQLRDYRSNNPDARPGLEAEVTNRINSLHRDIEQANLQYREMLIRKNSLEEQLAGEAAITISQTREGQYRTRISELQEQLEVLRLDYQDTYPDIVRSKHQIEDLKKALKDEIDRREEARLKAKESGSRYIDEGIILNPLYQQLRGDLSGTETQIATLKARVSEMGKMLENEYERARRMHEGEAALSRLTRDYQVNNEIYQDLLRRMERARVSRSLDEENQGLTFKIQEPATVPLLPTGIRFIHFAAAGLILGLLIPVGLIYIVLQVDPRIRFSQIIVTELQLPLLAEIPVLTSHSEEKAAKLNLIMLGIGFGIVFVIYGIVGWLKFTGQL